MLLADFLDPRTIVFEQRILTREQIYRDIIERISLFHKDILSNYDDNLLKAILDREKEAPMVYPSGIAIPHIRLDGLADTLIGMTFLQTPLNYNGIKVNWIVMIFTDKTSSKIYLNIVAALLKISQDSEIMNQLRSFNDGIEVINYLRQCKITVGQELSVADLMVKNPVCIQSDDTLSKINSLMNEFNISLVPVVDENGNYVGEVDILNVLKVGMPDYLMMIDDITFLRSYEPLESLFEKEEIVKAGEIMQKNARVLSPTTSIVETVYYMIKENKRHFCIVEKGYLVGIITAMDIFRKVIKA
ncbi:MAG: CBS domain-containing protein [Candidatus Cloacimonadaceae bacterium]|jgi:CBS domain-containing protein|nr:PTS sugar transporter subunit IIA [Candidatus Cloacimonadota bacterium]